jgi:AICAR transformylase/IMP cyclohydrolase PurH
VAVAVGGNVVGIGRGHSRRVAETEAAAHAIETLRESSGGEREVSPELAEFLGAAGDDHRGDWVASEEAREHADESWTEINLDLDGI